MGNRSIRIPLTAWTGSVLGLVSFCGVVAAAPTFGPISSAAYPLITQRIQAGRSSFFVYMDQDSGFNHGFPSGFFASSAIHLKSISVDTGCIDDTKAQGGVSSDPTRLDRQRGTVMKIAFGPQATGEWAGLNFEDPESWGANGAPSSNGYDLRGATSLVLDVRSPTGIKLKFGCAGSLTASYVTIPKGTTYTTLSFPLASMVPKLDLSKVHLLFTAVVNDVCCPSGGTVLLDNIRFTPTPTSQASVQSFPLATQTFGILPAKVDPFPLDQVLRNVTTIYESSLAELVMLARGTASDLAQARIVADAFDYALWHDNNGDPIPVSSRGSVGMHDGYISGMLALFNNQIYPKTGQAGGVRIAGFTCSPQVTPSGYAVVLDGATGGNNAFAIYALASAYRQFKDPRYLKDAITIGNWIYENLLDPDTTGCMGYFVGYPDEGAPPPKPLIHGKSTENNADIFQAFTQLAALDTANASEWSRRASIAGDFVMRMFDSVNGRFNAGTVPSGTPVNLDNGTAPDASQIRGPDEVNTYDFLDVNTFTTLAMAGSQKYGNAIDWRKPVQYALTNFSKSATVGKTTYQGVSLVKSPLAGQDGVAFEFTGQMVVAMKYVDSLYSDKQFESAALNFVAQIRKAQTSAPFADGSGIVASIVNGGDIQPPLLQGLTTPYQTIPERVGLAATCWGVLAESNVNMFLPLPVK